MYSFKKNKTEFGKSEFKHKWFRKGLKLTNIFNISILEVCFNILNEKINLKQMEDLVNHLKIVNFY